MTIHPTSTNEAILREIGLLLEKNNVAFFAFSVYSAPINDDKNILESVIITIGQSELTYEERKRTAQILIDLGNKILEGLR